MNFDSKTFEPLIKKLNSSLVKSKSLIFDQINVCYNTKIKNMEQIFVLLRARELNITKRSKMKNASFKDREIAIIATMLECNGSIKGFPEFVIAAVDIG